MSLLALISTSTSREKEQTAPPRQSPWGQCGYNNLKLYWLEFQRQRSQNPWYCILWKWVWEANLEGDWEAWTPVSARRQRGPMSSIQMCIPVLPWVKSAWGVWTEVVETVSCVTRGTFLTALAHLGASYTRDECKLDLVHGKLTDVLE